MDNYNPKQLYTWYKHENTEEWHLFKTVLNPKKLSTGEIRLFCTRIEEESVCEQMDFSDAASDRLSKVCVREDGARMQAAEILKRTACGNCVATLYSTQEY
ncbi:hypothetical protein EHQ75_15990 [Leptospira levettii]|uniref:hypothetical protein n=1 Tax=Leptospira levettii TaxID=2023178 RepID=UPI0010842503|nr:hypothetical protein [Leptospira levettii]TGM35689.1 hypothetical protein EHQ75_15990 [Leptospira levettii]